MTCGVENGWNALGVRGSEPRVTEFYRQYLAVAVFELAAQAVRPL